MRATALAGVSLVLGVVLSSACSHRATKVDAGSGGGPARDAGPGGQAGTFDAAPADAAADVVGDVVDAAPVDVPATVVDAAPDGDSSSDADARADAGGEPVCSGCDGDQCGQPACCSTRKVCGEGETCTAGQCVVVACPGLLGLPGPPAPAIDNSPGWLATGDLNRDGVRDVIVSELGLNQATVLLGRGNATFATPVNYTLDDEPGTCPVLGDVNGDGDLDVVAGTTTGGRVLINAGDGSLSVSADHPTTDYATALGLADLAGAVANAVATTGASQQDTYVLRLLRRRPTIAVACGLARSMTLSRSSWL